MEPAASIIAKFGGNAKVAEITGVHHSRVADWKRPKAVKGTGGTIPIKHINKLLAEAERQGIPLTAADFLPVEETA